MFLPVGRLLVIPHALGINSACNRGASVERAADAKIDALFGEWNRPDSAGCGVGVNRKGPMVFERSHGMANLEQKVPITGATLFDPASIAKPRMSSMIDHHRWPPSYRPTARAREEPSAGHPGHGRSNGV